MSEFRPDSGSLKPLPRTLVEGTVRSALLEDLGSAGDLTSGAVIPAGDRATALLSTRRDGVLAGADIAALVFQLMDPELTISLLARDGDRMEAGDRILEVSGNTCSILAAERVAVNFVQRLSGIASACRGIVDAIAHTKARLLSTRKTTPNLRALEKHAVRAGGALNHRIGLYDGILIKDNHLAALGGDIETALARARNFAGHMVSVEIEVESLHQLERVLATRLADAVLLDNMSVETLRKAVSAIAERLIVEASGSITANGAGAIAETGVDYISSGWITHSAPALDLGLDIG